MSDQTRLTDEEQDRWQELHEVPLDDLSDAEIASKIKLSVKRRFDHPEWVVMFEYGAPGNDGSVCDCLALNTLPSRNYKVVGFEFKASRSDWLREKRDGQKNDYFVRMVDEFYLVAPKGIVEQSEIPDGWGYLELKPNSEQLYNLQDSDLTDHQQGEPSRRFWIRYVKQAVGDDSNYSKADLEEARSRGYQEAKDEGLSKHNPDYDIDRLRRKADSYDKLKNELGFLPWRDLDDDHVEMIDLAVQLVKSLQTDRFGGVKSDLSYLKDDIERKTESMQHEIEKLEEGFEKLQERVKDDPIEELSAETGGGESDAN